jgi:nucleoside-diphosphate-sugar epimerase
MNVFVAGATGLVGRRVIELLLDRDDVDEVCGISRHEEAAKPLQDAGAGIAIADAFDGEMLRGVFATAQPDVVINQLTALPDRVDRTHAVEQFAANDRIRIEGTRNLVIAARAVGAKRLIAQSIAFAYAPEGERVVDEDAPLHLEAPPPWGAAVAAIAALERDTLEAQGMDGVVLRYGTLYGSGTWYDADGGQVADAVRAGKMPLVGDGEGMSSFLHVDDAASAAVAAIDGPPGTYNVVDDEPAPAREWLPAYAEALGGPEPERISVDEAVERAGWLSAHRMTEQRGASNTRAHERLGWRPEHPTWRGELGRG